MFFNFFLQYSLLTFSVGTFSGVLGVTYILTPIAFLLSIIKDYLNLSLNGSSKYDVSLIEISDVKKYSIVLLKKFIYLFYMVLSSCTICVLFFVIFELFSFEYSLKTILLSNELYVFFIISFFIYTFYDSNKKS